MSFKKDFFEGMGSAFDLFGRNHFNEYDKYPGYNASLNQHWQNVGGYLGSSIDRFTSNRKLPTSFFSKPEVIHGKKLSNPKKNSFSY